MWYCKKKIALISIPPHIHRSIDGKQNNDSIKSTQGDIGPALMIIIR